jgi:hypothetical protein
MLKTISITIYLLYRHYLGGGTKSIAYESALMTVTFFVMIHILQIKVFFWGGGVTFGNTRVEKFLSISVVFIPIYFILTNVFKKRNVIDIQNHYSINYRKSYLYLIIYCFLTFGLLTFFILKSKNLI